MKTKNRTLILTCSERWWYKKTRKAFEDYENIDFTSVLEVNSRDLSLYKKVILDGSFADEWKNTDFGSCLTEELSNILELYIFNGGIFIISFDLNRDLSDFSGSLIFDNKTSNFPFDYSVRIGESMKSILWNPAISSSLKLQKMLFTVPIQSRLTNSLYLKDYSNKWTVFCNDNNGRAIGLHCQCGKGKALVLLDNISLVTKDTDGYEYKLYHHGHQIHREFIISFK
ncbi:hypothetical protein [Carboxylicivirga caseinilyticus]|uniref:hypothetical protein n=1 Tax=Carboxylicivirga caseinilyticus TaxID=3417572 RepID=UPI003D33F382|nr:hypothetical protein [Marinilabiliaceae bacterium A049]